MRKEWKSDRQICCFTTWKTRTRGYDLSQPPCQGLSYRLGRPSTRKESRSFSGSSTHPLPGRTSAAWVQRKACKINGNIGTAVRAMNISILIAQETIQFVFCPRSLVHDLNGLPVSTRSADRTCHATLFRERTPARSLWLQAGTAFTMGRKMYVRKRRLSGGPLCYFTAAKVSIDEPIQWSPSR